MAKVKRGNTREVHMSHAELGDGELKVRHRPPARVQIAEMLMSGDGWCVIG